MWSTVLTVTVTPGLAVVNAVTTAAKACFGTASERLEPNVTLPLRAAVEGATLAELAVGPVLAVAAVLAVGVAVAAAVLQAARTAGSTVSPAAPISPFFRTSRLETCPPESKPARFSCSSIRTVTPPSTAGIGDRGSTETNRTRRLSDPIGLAVKWLCLQSAWDHV